MKFKHLIYISLLATCILPSTVLASPVYEQGDGTVENPYVITTCDQLQQIGYYDNDLSIYPYLDSHFILGGDIDCTNVNETGEFEPIGYFLQTQDEELNPISSIFPFTGSLDGNNKKIQNLTIAGDYQSAGIFAVAQNSLFFDLTLENISVTTTFESDSDSGYIGGLVGVEFAVDNNVFLSNITVDGLTLFSPRSFTGGLAGAILLEPGNQSGPRRVIEYTQIFDADLTTLSDAPLGGIVGYVEKDLDGVDFEYSIVGMQEKPVTLRADEAVGGLIGGSFSGLRIIESQANYVNLIGKESLGGLAGLVFANSTIVENSVSNLTFSHPEADEENETYIAADMVGGLIGTVLAESINIDNNTVDTVVRPATETMLNTMYELWLENYVPDPESSSDFNSGNNIGGLIGAAASSNSIYVTNNNVLQSVEGIQLTGGIIGYLELETSDQILDGQTIVNIANNNFAGEQIRSINGAGGLIGGVGTKSSNFIDGIITLSQNQVNTDIQSVYLTGGIVGLLELESVARIEVLENYFNGVLTNPYSQLEFNNSYSGGLIGKYEADADTTFYLGNNYARVSLEEYFFQGGLIGFSEICTTCNFHAENNYAIVDYKLSHNTPAAFSGIGYLAGSIDLEDSSNLGFTNNFVIQPLTVEGNPSAILIPFSLITPGVYDSENLYSQNNYHNLDLPGCYVAMPQEQSPTEFEYYTDGCNYIDLDANPDYFFNNDNSPLALWDFDDVWEFVEGVNDGYPVLQFANFEPIISPEEPTEPTVPSRKSGSTGSRVKKEPVSDSANTVEEIQTVITYEQEVAKVLKLGIVTQNPTTETNKCEALTMMSRAFNWTVPTATTTTFTDVPDWCVSVAAFATSRGIVEGRTPTLLGLDTPITRDEVAVMIYRELQKQGYGFTGQQSITFTDSLTPWASEAILALSKEGIIKGYADGTFGGQNNVLKQDFAVMLFRTLK